MTVSASDAALARVLWDFNLAIEGVRRADVILVLGSHDLRVAARAAELYHQGWAPRIVFSGGLGRLTASLWTRPEAEMFAAVALQAGVPAERIVVESRSTNTGENVVFSLRALAERGLAAASFIVVQKPYMLRRAWATFKRHAPGRDVCVTTVALDFDAYPGDVVSPRELIQIMVGDFQRLRLYAERGFQVPVEIPDDAWAAYEELVRRGYTEHLVDEPRIPR